MGKNSHESLSVHINSITRAPLLTPSEEIHLGHAIQAWMEIRDVPKKTRTQRLIERRGRRAKERMILGNMRLVISIARTYRNKATKLEFEDLMQEGAIGLNRAAEKFDPEKGYKFSTYATWWIRQAVKRCIEVHNRTIRLPVHSIEKIAKARVFVDTYKEEHGKEPSLKEIAAHVGTRPDTIRDLLRMFRDAGSYDAFKLGHEEDNDPLLEIIAGGEDPMDVYKREEATSMIYGAVSELTDDTMVQCLSMLYGLHHEERRIKDIVKDTGAPWWQVRAKLARGRDMLKVKLTELGAQRCLD